MNTGHYNSETTWNEWNNGAGATGGGFSSVFARPPYQDGIPGIGAFRGVPDVAFVADPLTGVPVVVSLSGQTYHGSRLPCRPRMGCRYGCWNAKGKFSGISTG